MLRLLPLRPLLALSLLLAACSGPATDESATTAAKSADAPVTLRVAAAADLRYALDSLVRAFAAQQPAVRVDVSYGSSGKFYEQIRQGAPFGLFFSADSTYPHQLQQQGRTAQAPVPYATGRLVLWSRTLDPTTREIRTLLDARVRKIAIANPAHAPYGRKAVEVLRYYGLYEQVQPRLVLAENIAQAANFAASGAADAGLIALALAQSPELRSRGRYWLIPATAHTPLIQSYVVLKSADQPAAAQFTRFLASAPARQVLRAYGFSVPR